WTDVKMLHMCQPPLQFFLCLTFITNLLERTIVLRTEPVSEPSGTLHAQQGHAQQASNDQENDRHDHDRGDGCQIHRSPSCALTFQGRSLALWTLCICFNDKKDEARSTAGKTPPFDGVYACEGQGPDTGSGC